MASINRFEDLEVWKLAFENANVVYDLTAREPFSRDFVLRDQIRRSAISVFSNNAEGFERDGNKELISFLSIAKGSCGEVRAAGDPPAVGVISASGNWKNSPIDLFKQAIRYPDFKNI